MLAQDYAAFSGRNTPYAGDLARAQAESGWDVGRLKREAKKRRIGESDLAQCTLHVVCMRRRAAWSAEWKAWRFARCTMSALLLTELYIDTFSCHTPIESS